MKGIVVGGSPQTVEAGAEMLRQGGNAVDAVVAACFASYMSEIILSSPSGGGFALVSRLNEAPVLYDFFCNTPGLGTDRRTSDNLDFEGITVTYESDSSVYHLGRASTAVHGDVAGLAQLLSEQGTLPLAEVIQPALRLAREGYILNDYQAYLIQLVDTILERGTRTLELFAPEGNWLQAGERYINHGLADTLEQIATDGWETMYTGAVAQAILADQQQRGGLITATDLQNYQVVKRQPLKFSYADHTVYTNPPPSAGGILIAYAMRLFKRADFSTITHGSVEHVALLAEVERQVMFARQRDNPIGFAEPAQWQKWLTNSDIEADWQLVTQALASKKPRHAGHEPHGHASTTHISVIDETGLAVGLTTTPGETAGYIAGKTGILMNNMLGEEELNPVGFHEYAAGKRLSSMMAPTIIEDADGLQIVVGSGGAARLRSAIFQVLSNLLDWQLTAQESVQKPRLHLDGATLHFEGGYNPMTAEALEKRGYPIRRWGDLAFYFGGAHTAIRTSSGKLNGAGDSRRNGSVAIVD